MTLTFDQQHHADGSPRFSFLQRIKRAYDAFGWRFIDHRAPGMTRMLRRARALDTLERVNPAEYRRRMSLTVQRAIAMDAAECAPGRVARTKDRDARQNAYRQRMHRALDHLLERCASRGARAADQIDDTGTFQRLQAAYDARRAAGGEFYRPSDGRARDAQRDPIDMRHGVSVTPYHDLQEVR